MGNANSTSSKKKRSGCFLSSTPAADSDDDHTAANAPALAPNSASSSGNELGPLEGTAEANTKCEPARSDGTDGGGGTRERPPPRYKHMPREFMEQAFMAYDIKAVAAVTEAQALDVEQLGRLVALRPLFVESPYLRGGRSPDEICAAVYSRMCRLAQNDAAAGEGSRIQTPMELLTLVWRLLRAPSEQRWEALVYLFCEPADCGEACIAEEDFAHFLALVARLAVEISCAVVGRSARRAYLSYYRGELGHASIAKWIAENETRSRRSARVLAAWADERLPNLTPVVGGRVLMQAIEAASLGAAGSIDRLEGLQREAEGMGDAGKDGGEEDDGGDGEALAAWQSASVVSEVGAGLVPMLDKQSHILSLEGLFLLQAFLPRSSAQGLKRLYCSKADGHSLNRLSHCITGYKGPSLVIFKDQLQRVIAILNSQEWRDSHMFQGDSAALILTLAPRFSCLRMLDAARDRKQPKSNFFYLNTGRGTPMSKARGGVWPVKGMGAGGDAGSLRLAVDENLEGVRWASGSKECATFQGGGCDWSPPEGQIDVCEAWGLGGADAEEAQEKFRIRQMKMITRARTVDRAAMFGVRRADGGWDDCPDKFILDIAGVTSANSDDYRR